MQVNLRSLKEMFEPNRVYRVPQFQRHYVWSKDEQWESLWEDVREAAEQCLKDDVGHVGPVDQSHPADHFLGAIVTQHADSESDVEIRSLIDGQQRLVTLQLLLSAIEEVFEGHVHTAARRIERITRNQEEFHEGDCELIFKVQPTAADDESFRDVLNRQAFTDERNETIIANARTYFLGEVSHWVEMSDAGVEKRVKGLERAVRDHIKMVVIELANLDDEHLIFETLDAHSTLFLNKDVLAHSAGGWCEADVEARALRLADAAIRTWPRAGEG